MKLRCYHATIKSKTWYPLKDTAGGNTVLLLTSILNWELAETLQARGLCYDDQRVARIFEGNIGLPVQLTGAVVELGDRRFESSLIHKLKVGRKEKASESDITLHLQLRLHFGGEQQIHPRLAIALQDDGWWVRSDIIWHKPNPMPESVEDRPTKAHEYIYLLSKSADYYYDFDAIKEPATGNAHDRARRDRSSDGQKTLPTEERNGMRPPGVNPKAQKWPNAWSAEEGRHDGVGDGRFRPKQNESFSAAVTNTVEDRNKRSVWTVPTSPFPEAHFATFPQALILPCILAGCPEGGTVLDPFAGAFTTGLVAEKWGRNSVLIELNPDYVTMGRKRLDNFAPLFLRTDEPVSNFTARTTEAALRTASANDLKAEKGEEIQT